MILYTKCSILFTYIYLLFFSEGRITWLELKSLVEKMQNLPCVVNQLEGVQVRN